MIKITKQNRSRWKRRTGSIIPTHTFSRCSLLCCCDRLPPLRAVGLMDTDDPPHTLTYCNILQTLFALQN